MLLVFIMSETCVNLDMDFLIDWSNIIYHKFIYSMYYDYLTHSN